MTRGVLFAAAVAVAGAGRAQLNAPAESAGGPPKAAVREVRETFFGTTVSDPYRYFEDGKSPEVKDWLAAQDAHARQVLSGIPAREAYLTRVRELDGAIDRLRSVTRVGERYFYLKTLTESAFGKLYVRDGLDGAERVLVDTETRSTAETPVTIDFFSPSFDGRYVGVGISSGGSEWSAIELFDVASGERLSDRLEEGRHFSPQWLPDGKSFVYGRITKRGPGGGPAWGDAKVYRHTLGADAAKDPVVFGPLESGAAVDGRAIHFAVTLAHSPYVLGCVGAGTSREYDIFGAEASTIGEPGAWKRVVRVEDGVHNFALHGDDLYVLSHRNAPRSRLLRFDIKDGDLERAEVLLPEGQGVLKAADASADALWVLVLEGGNHHVLYRPWGAERFERVTFPVEGAIELAVDSAAPGALATVESWNAPERVYRVSAEGAVRETKLQPLPPIDVSELEVENVTVASADGTRVPLSIVFKRGLTRDGNHPTILYGYGAYGFSITPMFNPLLMAWFERGGVYATAHVRGGGEYGDEWHQGGRRASKANAVADFIAGAEHLIASGYTSPRRLAAWGRSAGGLLVGSALTKRPDLFAAVFSGVGVSNPLRFEHTEGGPANVEEFGTVKTEEGFRGLLAVDGYHGVKDGVAYPAVILTAGVNDPRVPVWQAAKMTARLQAASTSGRPVLLRLETGGGHWGVTRTQATLEHADVMSFLLWQLGVPEFQPKAASPGR